MVHVNDTAIKFTLPTQFPQTMLSYWASVSYILRTVLYTSNGKLGKGLGMRLSVSYIKRTVPGRPLSPATARANLLCLVAENWYVFSRCVRVCVCVCVCVSLFQYSNLACTLLSAKPFIHLRFGDLWFLGLLITFWSDYQSHWLNQYHSHC